MSPTSIPVRPTVTAGVHYQHVIDGRGTKLLACLLCSADAVPFFVHRDDYQSYDTESGLFSAMYARMISHLYSVHADALVSKADVSSAAQAVEKLTAAITTAVADDPDLESLIDPDPDPSDADALHDAVFAVARKHGGGTKPA